MNEIIHEFIDFTELDIISDGQISPDEKMALLTLSNTNFDKAKFVLIETDYFDKQSAKLILENNFDVKFLEWVQPKAKKIISEEDPATGDQHDAVDVVVTHDEMNFALALVEAT